MKIKGITELVSFTFLILVFLSNCKQKKETDSLYIKQGTYWVDTIPYPERNPITVEGVALGRMLFYDPILSAKGNISCATCHQQSLSFSDGIALSNRGNTGKPLERHAQSLINLAWHNGFFWDGGAKNLESLVFAPLTHPDEMAADIPALIEKLNTRFDYKARFNKVFKQDTIHAAFIARALAQFKRTLISDNSRYDQIMQADKTNDNLYFSALEFKGKLLFEEKCSSCHAGLFFTDFQYHNNGLDSIFPTDPEAVGKGRARITLKEEDMGKFKTPTLRNIALTAPYMHDGRFGNLYEVMKHYSKGIKYAETLDSLLINEEGQLGIHLEESEQQALIAFLQTLTDSSFITNESLSNPFIK